MTTEIERKISELVGDRKETFENIPYNSGTKEELETVLTKTEKRFKDNYYGKLDKINDFIDNPTKHGVKGWGWSGADLKALEPALERRKVCEQTKEDVKKSFHELESNLIASSQHLEEVRKQAEEIESQKKEIDQSITAFEEKIKLLEGTTDPAELAWLEKAKAQVVLLQERKQQADEMSVLKLKAENGIENTKKFTAEELENIFERGAPPEDRKKSSTVPTIPEINQSMKELAETMTSVSEKIKSVISESSEKFKNIFSECKDICSKMTSFFSGTKTLLEDSKSLLDACPRNFMSMKLF